MEAVGNKICKSLWRDHHFDWAVLNADGNSTGILSIWNDKVFCKMSSWFVKGALVVNGFLHEDGK